jgi:hypothetical protein
MIDAADVTSVIDGGGRWYAYKLPQDHTMYAWRKIRGAKTNERMHRVLTPNLAGLDPDHINRDGLDNRVKNLRPATHSQNARNKRKLNGGRGFHVIKTTRSGCATSDAVGVYFDGRRWHSGITVNGIRKTFSFRTEDEAKENRRRLEISAMSG